MPRFACPVEPYRAAIREVRFEKIARCKTWTEVGSAIQLRCNQACKVPDGTLSMDNLHLLMAMLDKFESCGGDWESINEV